MAIRPRWTAAPILGVRDVRRAAEYYRDVLGFALDPETGVFEGAGDEPGGLYAIVERDGAAVHFQIRRGDLPARRRESLERDVYVYVDDVDALDADLRRRGATLAEPPRNAPYGLREIVAEDPDGHRVAFGSPVKSATAPRAG